MKNKWRAPKAKGEGGSELKVKDEIDIEEYTKLYHSCASVRNLHEILGKVSLPTEVIVLFLQAGTGITDRTLAAEPEMHCKPTSYI